MKVYPDFKIQGQGLQGALQHPYHDLSSLVPKWMDLGGCQGRSELFIFEEPGFRSDLNRLRIERAQRVCRHACPVYEQCAEWAERQPTWSHVVVAGEYYYHNRRVDLETGEKFPRPIMYSTTQTDKPITRKGNTDD
jgi:hypothetical protein